LVYFSLILQQLIGSTTHLVAQDASQLVSPSLLLILRAGGASLLFLPVLWATEKRLNFFSRIERADYGRVFLIGMLNVPINQFLYLHGVKYTTPANSALLYALTPAMVYLLLLVARRERLDSIKLSGIVIALAGCALIMFERGATLQSDHTVGNILIFIAVIAWALFTMLGRPLVLKYGPVYITALNMIVGTLIYIPVGLIMSDVSQVVDISGISWLRVAYLASIASVLNYILWYSALAKLETTKVAVFQNLQPILTTIIALILARVVMTAKLGIGGTMALAGVLIVQIGHQRIKRRETSRSARA
jgi:drug/metabolite transporter (DMT)-like permease